MEEMGLDCEAPHCIAYGRLKHQVSRSRVLQNHFESGVVQSRHAAISLKKIVGLNKRVDEKMALFDSFSGSLRNKVF